MAKNKKNFEMKNKYVYSPLWKIIYLSLEFIFIAHSVFNYSKDKTVFIVTLIISIIIILIDKLLFSFVTFTKQFIKIFNKFKIIKINYNEIKRIELYESRNAHFFSKEIIIKLILKDNTIKKINVGLIIRYNKLIKYIKDIAKYRCIKFVYKEMW